MEYGQYNQVNGMWMEHECKHMLDQPNNTMNWVYLGQTSSQTITKPQTINVLS